MENGAFAPMKKMLHNIFKYMIFQRRYYGVKGSIQCFNTSVIFRENRCTYTLTFDLFRSADTLKIRARSPKPNQVFIMPQWIYPCKFGSNLSTISSDILCMQESITSMPISKGICTKNNMLSSPSMGRHNHVIDFKINLSRNMWFPTMWHFDMCRLRQACATSFNP